MANINEELNEIQAPNYGGTLRQSIAEAIRKVNELNDTVDALQTEEIVSMKVNMVWQDGTGAYSKRARTNPEDTYNACVASGNFSTADGCKNTSSGAGAYTEGFGNTASGTDAHAEGNDTLASASYCHSECSGTRAYGYASHAEGGSSRTGDSNDATKGHYAHAEGNSSKAIGTASHAEGYQTEASGEYSHSEGYMTKAYSAYTHAEGYGTKIHGVAAHAFGMNNADLNDGQVNPAYVEIVGNGADSTNRSNARTLTWTGVEWVPGGYETNGGLTLGKGTADEVTLSAAQLKALLALLNG